MGNFSDPARPPSGTPVRGSRDEGYPASFVIPNTWEKCFSILLGWTAVGLELGYDCIGRKTNRGRECSNQGGGGEDSSGWYRGSNEQNGDPVDSRATAAIRLG